MGLVTFDPNLGNQNSNIEIKGMEYPVGDTSIADYTGGGTVYTAFYRDYIICCSTTVKIFSASTGALIATGSAFTYAPYCKIFEDQNIILFIYGDKMMIFDMATNTFGAVYGNSVTYAWKDAIATPTGFLLKYLSGSDYYYYFVARTGATCTGVTSLGSSSTSIRFQIGIYNPSNGYYYCMYGASIYEYTNNANLVAGTCARIFNFNAYQPALYDPTAFFSHPTACIIGNYIYFLGHSAPVRLNWVTGVINGNPAVLNSAYGATGIANSTGIVTYKGYTMFIRTAGYYTDSTVATAPAPSVKRVVYITKEDTSGVLRTFRFMVDPLLTTGGAAALASSQLRDNVFVNSDKVYLVSKGGNGTIETNLTNLSSLCDEVIKLCA